MSKAAGVVVDTRSTRPVGQHDGVFFLGRPTWLSDDLLVELRTECQTQRITAEHIRAQHFAEVGPVGRRLTESVEILTFVAENAAPAVPSGKANYRYYDIPNSHVLPHIDTDDFALNLIIMLDHQFRSERRSALLLFPHGPDPVTLMLEPGEVILFYAKEVVHARTPVSKNNDEQATNMGIGFTPIAGVDTPGYWHPTDGWTPA